MKSWVRLVFLAIVLATAVACGVAAAAVPNKGTFSGTTSQQNADTKQNLQAEVKVKKGGKRIKRVRFQFLTDCSDGSHYDSAAFMVPPSGHKISDKGKWAIGAEYSPPDLGAGESGLVEAFMRGKFKTKNKVKGTIEVTARITTAAGQITCNSGVVKYSAKRP